MIYQSHFTQGAPKLYAQPYQRNGYPPKEKIREDVVPAFTVADLLEVLPKAIWDDVKGWSLLVIRFRSKGFPRVGYEAEHGIIWSCGDVSLLGNIIETIDWVVTNGYGLNL